MAKNERPAVMGANHFSAYPNPRAYGLRAGWWKKVQKHVDELIDLGERDAKQRHRQNELRAELEHQKRKLAEEFAVAARAGADDPDDKFVRITEAEIAKVEQRIQGIYRAKHAVEQDLLAIVEEVPEAVIAELREKGREHQQNYEEFVARAHMERDQLGRWFQLHSWARKANTNYHGERERFLPLPPGGPNQQPWWERPIAPVDRPVEEPTVQPGTITTHSG